MSTDDLPEDTEEQLPPSKSELKREMDGIRRKAESLIELPEKKLAELPLSDQLREGIALARRLKKTDARRRQIQYLAKLMKLSDMTAIDNALAKEQEQNRNFQQRFHKIEKWRDQMLEDTDNTIELLLSSYPQLERQHLRQLARQAKREASLNKPPAASRKIFKYLEENIR